MTKRAIEEHLASPTILIRHDPMSEDQRIILDMNDDINLPRRSNDTERHDEEIAIEEEEKCEERRSLTEVKTRPNENGFVVKAKNTNMKDFNKSYIDKRNASDRTTPRKSEVMAFLQPADVEDGEDGHQEIQKKFSSINNADQHGREINEVSENLGLKFSLKKSKSIGERNQLQGILKFDK